MFSAVRNTALAAVSSILLFGASAALAAPITYNLVNDPTDQSGWTLSGTITTDGTLGSISTSNVTSWTLSISMGKTTDTFSSSDSGAAVEGGSGFITATTTAITVNTNNGQFLFVDNGGKTQIDWGFDDYEGFINGTYFWAAFPATGFPASGIWTIATAAAPAVPEPASLALFGVGLAGLGIVLRTSGVAGAARLKAARHDIESWILPQQSS